MSGDIRRIGIVDTGEMGRPLVSLGTIATVTAPLLETARPS